MCGKSRLRCGVTTGTCGAAAVKAAALWLLGITCETAEIMTPKGILVKIPVEKKIKEEEVWFAVKKDAGDDPDVTNGVWVYGRVESLPVSQIMKEEPQPYQSEKYPCLFLTGGKGIGVVSKPGLACPVGGYAINPVPRSMIFQAAGEVLTEREEELGKACLIRLQIPEGEQLAKKTFNPKLGIIGGISVLGTSGIVEPMSEKALLEAVCLEIHMRAVQWLEEGTLSSQVLLLAPGNYGENFLEDCFGISRDQVVLCSNFVADSIACAQREGIKKILFAGHIGKLIKIAGGVRNTHSKYGDRRMEIMAEIMMEITGQDKRLQTILDSNTTEEALSHLEAWGLRRTVMDIAVKRIQAQMSRWGLEKLRIEVVVFSAVYGILGTSETCYDMMEEWRKCR